jgi:hypothetical protein
MAQHDYNIANQSGQAFRADLNNALAAIVSQNSGASAPSTTYAYQYWVDTSTSPATLKQRNSSNNAWITIGQLDTANLGLIPAGSGSIVNADVNANAGIASSKLSFTQAGTGASARTVQARLRDIVSVKDFGAVGDGVTDDTAAIQAAITAATNVLVPPGTYGISSQITSTGNLHLTIQGTLKPLSNAGSPGTALLKVTGSNCTIRFDGAGGIDCVSASFSNWNGIAAGSASSMIEAVEVYGGAFRNVGLNNTSAAVISFSAVKSGTIRDTSIKNCGVVGNVSGGGFGIYTDNCEAVVVDGNTLDTVGSTGINMSCGLNNVVSNNAVNKITLFGFKGGYGLGPTVTNNVAPSTTVFTVAKNASSLRSLKIGQAFYIPRASSFPSPQGIIKSIVDNSTYLTVTTMVAMGATPTVGEQVQPLDTNCLWHGNSLTYCGENAFDQNGIYNITITSNRLMHSGWYDAVGSFAGLRGGIWIGYDPQGSLNSMHNTGALIANNVVQHTYGTAIEIFSTNNVVVNDNTCFFFNEGQDPSSASPAYGGISVGRLGYYRNTTATITNNTCRSSGGYGIYIGFSSSASVTGNNIQCPVGIKGNSMNGLRLASNLVSASRAGGYGILISDDSGANNSSSVYVSQNSVYHSAASGDCIRITDTGLIEFVLSDDNLLNAANTAVNRVNDSSTSASAIAPRGDGGKGAISTRPMRFSLAPGATFKLAEYVADPGTMGGARVFGFMRNGTSGFEYFEVFFFGNTTMPAVSFSSKGSPNGSAFLASGDFTVSTLIAGTLLGCNYTNNETNTVYASAWVQSFSRI